jgi:hypothetical protein
VTHEAVHFDKGKGTSFSCSDRTKVQAHVDLPFTMDLLDGKHELINNEVTGTVERDPTFTWKQCHLLARLEASFDQATNQWK